MRFPRGFALLCIALFVAGCGGGSTLPGSASSPAADRTGKAVFRILVPKRKKHAQGPAFVSPSTQSLAIAIAGPTNVNTTLGLTPSSTGCSQTFAGTACSFSEQIAPGSYTATVTSYDGPNGTGKVLSAAQGVAFTVVAAASNQVNLTLSGVPQSLQIVPATSFSALNLQGVYDLYGTAAHRFFVDAFDADGNAIVGPGSPSFSVAVTHGSLVVTVGEPIASAPNAFTITPPVAYVAGTQQLTVTATYAPGLSNGCAQPGANCTATLTVDMQELVAAAGNNALTIYPMGQTRALATITYAVNFPNGIAFDAAGDLFIANCLTGCGNGTSVDNVAVYTPPYTGLPVVITTGVNTPQTVAVNASGDLFVANCVQCGPGGGTDNVAEYAPPFTAASSPLATLTNGIGAPQALAFDASANLFVANCPASCAPPFNGNDTVTKYSPPYTGAPAATIGSGLLNGPNLIALDGSGNLFVSDVNNNNVVEFLSPTYPTLTAVTISNGINAPQGLALDATGDLFVANNGGTNTVTFYTIPLSNGSTPATTVSTNVSGPNQIAVDGLGNLYVTDPGTGRFYSYPLPYTGAGTRLNSSGEYLTAVLP
jgi:hypothetical protein